MMLVKERTETNKEFRVLLRPPFSIRYGPKDELDNIPIVQM